MKFVAILLFVTLFCCTSAKYEGFQVWRMRPSTDAQKSWLRDLPDYLGDEIDFWTSITKLPNHPVDIMVPPRYQDRLRDGLKTVELDYDVMIPDVGSLVSNQMADIMKRRESEISPQSLADFNYYVYHPYYEIQQWVADVAAEYSDIASEFLLGYSYEGRAIHGLKIRGTGSQSSTPPAVWFEGGIHAREWVSPATVMGFTQLLLDAYHQGNSSVTDMFDNVDWYIVPSLNPDGYVYTWEEDRMWRKTRTPNQGSPCTGTDPNRNWPFQWGGPGTSPWPCSDIYHGPAPISEIEVKNVVSFLRKRKSEGQDFILVIDWHSYSQLIIAPWSYLDSNPRTNDYDDQMAFARDVSAAIYSKHGMTYEYGAGAEILYAAAGSSKDWGYAEYAEYDGDTNGGLGAKYAYTVELRDTGSYGFLLPEDQIQPTIEEIYEGVLVMGEHILCEIGVPDRSLCMLNKHV